MCDEINLENAMLFLDSNRGVYIPQNFAEIVKRDCVSGVTEDDWNVLAAGPDHESYWDVWNDVESNARVTDPDSGIVYYLYQDGDLWLVPEVNVCR